MTKPDTEPRHTRALMDYMDTAKSLALFMLTAGTHAPEFKEVGTLAMVPELTLTRAVDNFLTYLSDLLALIFEVRPEALRSKEEVTYEFVLEHSSLDDLVHALAERKVESLSRASVRDLASYFDKRLGFQLFESADELANATSLVAQRNLIVHNRSRIDRRYLSLVPEAPYNVGDRLKYDDDTFGDESGLVALLDSAVSIDARAVAKWSLPTVSGIVPTVPSPHSKPAE